MNKKKKKIPRLQSPYLIMVHSLKIRRLKLLYILTIVGVFINLKFLEFNFSLIRPNFPFPPMKLNVYLSLFLSLITKQGNLSFVLLSHLFSYSFSRSVPPPPPNFISGKITYLVHKV